MLQSLAKSLVDRTAGSQMDEKEDTKEDKKAGIIGVDNVKSTAVVKFAQLEMPARFHELLPNTNLNKPPSNWLYGSSKWESHIQNISMGKEHSFSSIKMAHSYPDLAGEIDVVADSEIIKKLLKIPYSKSPVSIMVHRVGSTLLLDEFDIHRHLLRKQANDWKWLRKFYYETVLQSMPEKDKQGVVKKNKRRNHLQQQNMFSKFLYYSVASTDNDAQEAIQDQLSSSTSNTLGSFSHDAQNIPDPLPKASPNQLEHQRTVVWNFEDLTMLIGTDLPIFGGRTHPCVTLRLWDMAKPINVLTGLDYWLDNLMCNVPELAMCYHMSGIVQSYELMKTEEIPNIQESTFSPGVVKDVAQNILSFLKSKATKEGHTYWLFKGNGDDVVKLYDLTTLCADITDDSQANPFTVPVGVLYYRVARNMRQRLGRKKSGTIRTLLDRCLNLLDKHVHAQVVTSAHYLLSDLYVSDDIYNLDLPNESDDSDNDEGDSESVPGNDNLVHLNSESQCEEEKSDSTSYVDVQALCLPDNVEKSNSDVSRYLPVRGSIEELSKEAIKHIAKGLRCLDENLNERKVENEPTPSKHVVEEQKTCNSFEAIPLHYEPIKKEKVDNQAHVEKSNNRDEFSDVPSANDESKKQMSIFTPFKKLSEGTWHLLSKTLLLRKAAICFYGLAKSGISAQKYGQAFRFTKLALQCFAAVEQLNPKKAKENFHILSVIFGIAGDLHIMISNIYFEMEEHIKDFHYHNDEEYIIIESLQKEVPEFSYEWACQIDQNTLVSFETALRCYELANEYARDSHAKPDDKNTIVKRMGNVLNEIGVHHMNKIVKLSAATENDPKNIQMIKALCENSQTCFAKGIQYFESLGDNINMALLHSNLGRLMRVYAQTTKFVEGVGKTDHECTLLERHYLRKAQQSYLKALDLINDGEVQPEILSSIQWELSTSFFTMATLLQDNAPLSTMALEHIEKEVTDLMIESLKYCDIKTKSPKLPQCEYRAATIHHRLASLHHNGYRNELAQQKKKRLRETAEFHYQKAFEMFSLLETPCEMLRIQLERVALCEYQLGNLTTSASKNKTLLIALKYLVDTHPAINNVLLQLGDPKEDSIVDSKEMIGELIKLLAILEARLQFILHQLVKNNSTPKKAKAKTDVYAKYKAMYAIVLKNSGGDKDNLTLLHRCQRLYDSMMELAPNLDS